MIAFLDVVEPLPDATLRVRIQDVSHADASAIVLAEQVIHGVSVSPDRAQVPIAFDLPTPDPRGIYAIEAHLDASGSGDVAVGDYLTMEHFGVDPTLERQTVDVRLRRVG